VVAEREGNSRSKPSERSECIVLRSVSIVLYCIVLHIAQADERTGSEGQRGF
jgi:hypothetical protein